MPNQPSVSVVVPAYNCSKTIFFTLQSLLSQSYAGPTEILVVDDGSTDTTADVIRSFKEVRYLRQDNAGPASARNRGAQEACGEVLFFTDSDCVPEKGWIDKMLQGFFRDDIAVVCGSYGIANPERMLARGIHGEILFRHQRLMPTFPKAFGSYNFCIKRAIFGAVKGFDAAYRLASGEDNDLSYKVLKNGYKIFFKKDALVKHYHTVRLKKYLTEQFRHGFWRVKMYADHPAMMKGDDYTFWKDMVELVWAAIIICGIVPAFFLTSFKFFLLASVVLLFLFEIYYGIIFAKKIFEGIFYGAVMFLRSFARLAGFSTGILKFVWAKIFINR